MTIDAEQLELEKNNLYRDSYRLIMRVLSGLVVMSVALAVILGYQIINTPQSKYFATTTTGEVIPLQSLSMPVVTNTYLLQWAELATRACYNLDFLHYDKQLANAETYFTPDGWTSLNAALNASDVINSLQQNKLFMSAVVSGPPVILDQEVIHGRYTWRVQLPLLVTYTSASEEHKSQFTVTMDIMRVPVIDAVKSIQINNFSVFRD